MRNLFQFSLGRINRKLSSINVEINSKFNKPFPKDPSRLLSQYSYQFRKIHISPKGYIEGGLIRVICALVNFSFIRAITANAYSSEGGDCYDPVSLFLLDLFRYINKYSDMKSFLKALNDKDQGRQYRTYAGISYPNIPVEADFSNFRVRIGEERYNYIFQILIDIAIQLNLITAKILSHDSSLYPTYARYRGCTYFSKDTCQCITVSNIIQRTKERILEFLNNPDSIKIGQIHKCRIPCPNASNFPKDVKPHTIELFSFSFEHKLPDSPEVDNVIKILELENELNSRNLTIKFHHSNITLLTGPYFNDSAIIRCPKLPYDLDARIGYRRRKDNPDKKERIFGFKVLITTTVEADLGLELPIACFNLPANHNDCNQLISLKQQLKLFHPDLCPKIDIADAGFDDEDNYHYIRAQGSIPVIDYNPRDEDLSPEALISRGYDKNGWPYGPCGCLMQPNGFDYENQRACFLCNKQCLKISVPEPIQNCQYLNNDYGCVKHMSIKDFSRLVNELIRGTQKYQTIRNLRPSSERTNSTIKDDFPLLAKPKTRGLIRTSIFAQISVIVALLVRMFKLFIKASSLLTKYNKNKDPDFFKKYLLSKSLSSILKSIFKKE